ncbi:hypothetical protein HZA71_01000 [Candidatus Falkowbacteria bacterium]|nr:hypothetical protein [Candidatus Falkowbacteria bacterium]
MSNILLKFLIFNLIKIALSASTAPCLPVGMARNDNYTLSVIATPSTRGGSNLLPYFNSFILIWFH